MQDWKHYLAANPDLLKAGITTQQEADRHYNQHGRQEGRCTRFEWRHYLAANPDLLAAGVNTEEQAVLHYLTQGFGEHRATTFAWRHYLAANPDFVAADVNTEEQALQHFLTHGFHENRPTTFAWRQYLAANPDLMSAGLQTEEPALQQYLAHGFHERRSKVFEWRRYLQANPDLNMECEQDALQHWILCGFTEGRLNQPQFDLSDTELTVVFVAHAMDLVLRLNRQYVQPHILFVGSKPVYPTDNPNVVVVRDLPFNIEEKWRLLTFTAWYAVVKNNLYPDCEHLCILEYDAHVVSETFVQKVKEAARTRTVVGFFFNCSDFLCDVRPEIIAGYLESKGVNSNLYGACFEWLSTTNICASRQFFIDFVAWYDYDYVVQHDNANLPFYHERLVAVYSNHTSCTTGCVDNVLSHEQKRSHSAIAAVTMVLYDDGTVKPGLNRLVHSVRRHSPSVRISYVKKTDFDPEFVAANARILQTPKGGGLWLWKPYCILLMLQSVKEGDVVVYLDSKYVFVAPVETLIQQGDLLVWKNKPNDPSFSHVKYCKQSVLAKYASGDSEQAWAGLLVMRKTDAVVAILREWLQMCCVYEDISDADTGANHAEFIDHRHDQSLLTIVLAKHGVPLLSLNTTPLQPQ